MGDIRRGRIFRVAPPKTPYHVPHPDYSSIPGAIDALQSPNLATRYLGWTALSAKRSEAEPALTRLFDDSPNPRMRARALWLLGNISHNAQRYIARAAVDANPDIRATAVRVAREIHAGLAETVGSLSHDTSSAVRRECAIALRNIDAPQRAALWVPLALQYDGHDRWYLEALGIGAEGDWDACLAAWLSKVGPAWNSPAGRDIVWRSRAAKTPELLATILESPATPAAELPRYLRAFDFLKGPEKERALVGLAFGDGRSEQPAREMVRAEAMQRLDPQEVLKDPSHAAALKRVARFGGFDSTVCPSTGLRRRR
jgi:hypothetical protein